MNPEDKKVQWKLRSGMLELDAMLKHFFSADYSTLNADERAVFVELLNYEDDDLFRLLMGHAQSTDERVTRMVRRIAQSMRESSSS